MKAIDHTGSDRHIFWAHVPILKRPTTSRFLQVLIVFSIIMYSKLFTSGIEPFSCHFASIWW